MTFIFIFFIGFSLLKEPLFPSINANIYYTVSFIISVILVIILKCAPNIHFYNVNKRFSQIDYMDGLSFEYWCAELLKKLGFYNVRVTKASGDYGADVVGYYKKQKIVVQCKRYSKQVNLKAVQEILGAKAHYRADFMLVITNNYFAPSAIQLARETGVILWDRSDLSKKIKFINGK